MAKAGGWFVCLFVCFFFFQTWEQDFLWLLNFFVEAWMQYGIVVSTMYNAQSQYKLDVLPWHLLRYELVQFS